MAQRGNLIFFCGKMAAGKSTLAISIAAERNAVFISEDEWLARLYPEQIESFDDYIKYAGLLRPVIKAHVQNILKTGTSVVMDFPANTKRQREWFNSLSTEVNAKAELIYLKVDNVLCLKQLKQRSIEQPARTVFDTEAMFYHVTQYFEEPEAGEIENIELVVKGS